MTGTDPIATLTTGLVALLTGAADFAGKTVIALEREDYQVQFDKSIAGAGLCTSVLVNEFEEDDNRCVITAGFIVEVELGGRQSTSLTRGRSLIFSARNALRRASPLTNWSGCAVARIFLLQQKPHVIWQLVGKTTLQLA